MAGGTGHFLLGLGLALMATIFSTVGNTLAVKVRKYTPNVLLVMAWGMLWGTLTAAGWAVLSGASFVLPTAPKYWAGLLYLSLFGSVIAFACYFTLIHRLGTQKAVYIGVVTPVISVLLSIRLENFRPGPLEWLGMALCLASVAWALRSPAAPASSQPLTLKKAS
jgi:drug/metabolite transporter (DMT)-like permease